MCYLKGEFDDKPIKRIKLRSKPLSKLIGRISIKEQSIHEITGTAPLRSVEFGSSPCSRALDDLTNVYSWFQQFNPYPMG